MKTLVRILIAVSLFVGLAGNASAARSFYNCDVVQIGPHLNGNIYIELTCASTGTKTWHVIDATLGSRGMAVGLAAIALGSLVTVNIDPAVPYSDLTAIFLKSQ